jgi:hypothetical protein
MTPLSASAINNELATLFTMASATTTDTSINFEPPSASERDLINNIQLFSPHLRPGHK